MYASNPWMNPDTGNYYYGDSGSGFNWGNLGSLFSAGLNYLGNQSFTNPSTAAAPYLQQISSSIQPYYQPYIDAGNKALPNLQEQFGTASALQSPLMQEYGNLIQNPTQKINQIGSQYEQSPGYQWQLQQALSAGNNAAAAGGMGGSPQHQQQNMQIASQMANQDYYNYLQNALSMYGQGIQGEQGLYNQGLQGQTGLAGLGYGAAANYGQNLAQSLAAQAQNAYSGQNTQNQNDAGGFGQLASLAGLAFSFL